MECTNFKDKFYPSNSNFFKIARTIFEMINFQDFVAPSLQNDAFDLQTARSGQPVQENGKHTTEGFGLIFTYTVGLVSLALK